MDNYTCNKEFCLNNIYDNSDYINTLWSVKNKLIKRGIVNWENHPEYTQLLHCKEIIGNKILTEDLCINNYKLDKKSKPKKKVTISEKNIKKHKKSNNKTKNLKRSKTKYPKKRCPNGTRRCKVSRNCIPFMSR